MFGSEKTQDFQELNTGLKGWGKDGRFVPDFNKRTKLSCLHHRLLPVVLKMNIICGYFPGDLLFIYLFIYCVRNVNAYMEIITSKCACKM